MPETLILYDLPTKAPKPISWSLNPWKSRLALNFKGVDYETEWVEYPDVEPKWKELGIKPNDPKDYFIAYTIPMVRFPDETCVMDSQPIAEKLEKLHPEPSLHLDWGHLPKVVEHVGNIVGTTRPIWMPMIPDILGERSAEYFQRTRKDWFGKSLKEMRETEGQEVDRWDKIKPDAKVLGDLIRESGGPYFMGKTPSHADFVVAGVIRCFQLADEDAYQRLLGLDPALQPLFEACGKWMERDDH